MSLEEEDNSPFAQSTIQDDEFIDLPLEEDEEEETSVKNDATEQKSSSSAPVNSDIPDSPTTLSTASQPPTANNYNTGTQAYNPDLYSSTSQLAFKDKESLNIEIIDAGKSREGHSRGYIVYTIKVNGALVRRRYSEFESLRTKLTKLFPTLIIPPIPEKHKITKYATAPTKAKEDSHIIEHRRRMLSVFLKRLLEIDQVRESQVYHSFLDPNANWPEVLSSPPISTIPKNILQADPFDPANSSAAHSYLPIPSSTVIVVKETADDAHFNQVEANAKEYESVISNGIDRINKKVVKHINDVSNEFSEAGAAFNAFSLEETGKLANILEKIGQVHDNSYLSTETLVNTLNFEFTEPLGESVHFASVVKDIIKFRQQKSLQLDITARTLKHKYNQLNLLQRTEEESRRIDEALNAESGKTGKINFDRKQAEREAHNKAASNAGLSQSSMITPLEHKKTSMFKIPGISKISSAIKEAIEPDPEVTRHNNYTKTKDDINQLRQTVEAAENDLKKVTESVHSELERFQIQKEEDLKKMILAYSSSILDWSRKNLEFWEEAKAEVDKV
ncbi:Sorting nexin-41 [Wickerhamomyces ciferrii]|uniref:Sorting nexin-41 n=1 Tax=Wickerhamomyces ciferrii (strain ATCC 14091 / BCRC 22168 / CBS 111 / JCM 3599 / NBRC 0793 / NRRL Y-1031 F-60-10) TaxID=1206466 RepID=K0KH32_WICCF|nr:Sorting nexin-41 [Wickerhamomyces ciferrii]CCH42276.1 Sorting nexin-41 [Wickerhamomyces ciferrii]